MNVFLSSAAADQSVAEVLRAGLERRGHSVVGGAPQCMPPELQGDVEQWIRSAQTILVLVGPHPDDEQRSTWQSALAAVWQDPAKHMVPVLLGDAKLPPFVRSAQAEGSIPVVRIDDPKDLPAATEAIVEILKRWSEARTERGRAPAPPESGSGEGQGPKRSGSMTFGGSLVTETPSLTEDDFSQRAARFEEIRRYAESLKSHP